MRHLFLFHIQVFAFLAALVHADAHASSSMVETTMNRRGYGTTHVTVFQRFYDWRERVWERSCPWCRGFSWDEPYYRSPQHWGFLRLASFDLDWNWWSRVMLLLSIICYPQVYFWVICDFLRWMETPVPFMIDKESLVESNYKIAEKYEHAYCQIEHSSSQEKCERDHGVLRYSNDIIRKGWRDSPHYISSITKLANKMYLHSVLPPQTGVDDRITSILIFFPRLFFEILLRLCWFGRSYDLRFGIFEYSTIYGSETHLTGTGPLSGVLAVNAAIASFISNFGLVMWNAWVPIIFLLTVFGFDVHWKAIFYYFYFKAWQIVILGFKMGYVKGNDPVYWMIMVIALLIHFHWGFYFFIRRIFNEIKSFAPNFYDLWVRTTNYGQSSHNKLFYNSPLPKARIIEPVIRQSHRVLHKSFSTNAFPRRHHNFDMMRHDTEDDSEYRRPPRPVGRLSRRRGCRRFDDEEDRRRCRREGRRGRRHRQRERRRLERERFLREESDY